MVAALANAFRLLRKTYTKFSADGCPRAGAALAYYSLFSLFPLLLLLISILSFLLASGMPLLVDARTSVLDGAANVMPQARDLLARSIDLALAARGATTVVGLLTLLWSASNAFTQLYQALNLIWGCTPAPSITAAIRSKLTAFAVVLGIGSLLLLSLVLNTALGIVLGRAHLLPAWRLLWSALRPLASAALASLVFALLYRYLPAAPGSWREVWPGALLAGVAWEALRQAFAVYASRTDYVAVYGAVGGTIALLTWIYFSAQVLFFGAEFAVVYACYRGAPVEARGRPEGAGETPVRERTGLEVRTVERLRCALAGLRRRGHERDRKDKA